MCTINVLIPTQGSLPPQPTPVTYDVNVVNPLYTIYGCFNTLG